jgi:hypothetical protein
MHAQLNYEEMSKAEVWVHQQRLTSSIHRLWQLVLECAAASPPSMLRADHVGIELLAKANTEDLQGVGTRPHKAGTRMVLEEAVCANLASSVELLQAAIEQTAARGTPRPLSATVVALANVPPYSQDTSRAVLTLRCGASVVVEGEPSRFNTLCAWLRDTQFLDALARGSVAERLLVDYAVYIAHKPSVPEQFVQETVAAAWNSAATQTAEGARELLLMALKPGLKSYPKLRDWLVGSLTTTAGKSALRYVAGTLLQMFRSDKRSLRLAKELRVGAESAAIVGVVEPVRAALVAGLEAAAKVMDYAVPTEVPAIAAPAATQAPTAGAPVGDPVKVGSGS